MMHYHRWIEVRLTTSIWWSLEWWKSFVWKIKGKIHFFPPSFFIYNWFFLVFLWFFCQFFARGLCWFFPNVEYVVAYLQVLDVVVPTYVVPPINGQSSSTRKIVVEVPRASKRFDVDSFDDNVFNEIFIFELCIVKFFVRF